MEDFDMEKSGKLQNFIKAVLIILVAVLILLGLGKLLLLKSEDGISQLESIRKQEKDTVDVIFLGSSHVYCNIATGVIWDNYGISSFDLGGAEAPAWVSYYHLKEALKNQKPKLVCYETSVAALYPMLVQTTSWAADNNYGMSVSMDRYNQLKVNSEEKDVYSRLFPLGIMHNRYAELDENDFLDVNNSVNYKGFDPRERVYPIEDKVMPETDEKVPCSEKAEEYIRKIIDLCRENDIELMFFVSPYDEQEEELKMYNYINSIADESGVVHIDFNEYAEDMGLDFGWDMHDYTHLNFFGNYKFSDYFGKIIKENYDVADHRGDELYSSWDVDAYKQRIERNNNTLAYAQHEPSEFAKNVLNEGYYAFVNISRGLGEGLDENMSESLEIMGIPGDKQVSGSAYILKDGEIISENIGDYREAVREGSKSLLFTLEKEGDTPMNVSLFVNDDEYKEEYDNLLFVYDYVNGIFVDKVHF